MGSKNNTFQTAITKNLKQGVIFHINVKAVLRSTLVHIHHHHHHFKRNSTHKGHVFS